ncbi:MAG: DUF551 domain-containing protein [Thermodesulfobacteriota bacterium]
MTGRHEADEKGVENLMDYFIMEWISIRDKLPPPNEKVLVFFGGGDWGAMAIKTLADDSDGLRSCWLPGGQEIANATHWMPLPPNPPEPIPQP